MHQLILSLLAFQAVGVLCQNDLFRYPVDCTDGDVYPALSDNENYLACRGNLARLKKCPAGTITDTKLLWVCKNGTGEDANANRNYSSCTAADTMKLVAYISPNGINTPFYGVCSSSTVLQQGMCRPQGNEEIIFDGNKCIVNYQCNGSESFMRYGDDCSEYIECGPNGQGTKRKCPNRFLFNGSRCVLASNYPCPGKAETSTTVTVTSSSKTTPTTPPTTITSATTPTTDYQCEANESVMPFGDDCSEYIQCGPNGQGTKRKCPIRFLFNGSRCVLASNYTCPGKAETSTTVTATTSSRTPPTTPSTTISSATTPTTATTTISSATTPTTATTTISSRTTPTTVTATLSTRTTPRRFW